MALDKKQSKTDIVTAALEDFFSKKILVLAFFPFAISFAILLFGLVLGIDCLLGWLIAYGGGQLPQEQTLPQLLATLPILGTLASTAIGEWLIRALAYLIGFFLLIYGTFALAMVITSFLTPFIVSAVQKRHYIDSQIEGFGGILSSLWFVIKIFLVFLLLLVLLIPFYFIPLINIVAFNIPFFYLFFQGLTYDVGSSITGRTDFDRIKKERRFELFLLLFALYLTSLIPFVNLFLPVFHTVLVSHFFFREQAKRAI